MPKPRKADTHQVARLYVEGWSIRQVARMLGLGFATVQRHLNKAGVEIRAGRSDIDKATAEERRKLVDTEGKQLYESGMSLDAIAFKLGLDPSFLKYRLKRLGVRIRPRSESLVLLHESLRAPEGTRTVGKNGYVLVKVSDYFGPSWDGWVKEHVLVWESHYGPPPSGHVVHHLNGNKQDNRIENLRLMADAEHRRLHGSGRSGRQELSHA